MRKSRAKSLAPLVGLRLLHQTRKRKFDPCAAFGKMGSLLRPSLHPAPRTATRTMLPSNLKIQRSVLLSINESTRLAAPETSIQPALCFQILMGSLFDDLAIIQDNDAIHLGYS